MREEEYFEVLKHKWDNVWPHPSLPKEPMYPLGEIPIHKYLEHYAERQPSKDYLIYYGKRISYKEMDELSNKLANYLIENGFKKGDRVALVLPNMPQFYIAYFGTLKAGGICVLLNPMLKEIELEYFFKESMPKFVLTLDSIYPIVDKAAKKVSEEIKIIATSFKEFFPEYPEIQIHPSMDVSEKLRNVHYLNHILSEMSSKKIDSIEVTINDNATMNFTGGTTGLPKGVYHQHLDIVYTGACIYTYYNAHLLVELYSGEDVEFKEVASEFAKDEVVLAAMPVFWIAGNDVGLVYPTLSGSSIVLLSRWDIKATIESIHKYRVTMLYLTFDIYWEMLNYPEIKKYDLSSLRTCMGSSFTKGLTRELRDKWKEFNGVILREAAYGLTESHTCDTFTAGFHKDDMDIERAERYGGSFCGIPCPGTLIKIVDENGKLASFGEQGEVVITSPAVVKEYVGRVEDTAKAFKEGWLFTGDIGMYDEDGFFFYISRQKYGSSTFNVEKYIFDVF